ncbi:hypothetical protein [Nocardioides sp. ChNu-99]|uniref:hypothetical protein n=1 Tax=Nocardioides sp. ChNu-99 TaxID=2839897 RepID=UPI002406FE89|nr:hypothetical protein [Nocardioides sp. ChNu-99]MDF9716496.1 hypothetical protein [Nocardioides sp. ChNu-99]
MSNWNPDPSSSQPGQPTPPPYGSQTGANPPGAYQGAPFNGGAYGGPTGSLKRPGTVTAASVITWFSTLVVGATALFGLIGSVASRDTIADELRQMAEDDPDFREQLEQFNSSGGLDAVVDATVGLLVALSAVVLVWCLVVFVLTIFAFKGSSAARIAVVVSCIVSALALLLVSWLVFPIIFILLAIVATVLFFVGGASEWYRNKSLARRRG